MAVHVSMPESGLAVESDRSEYREEKDGSSATKERRERERDKRESKRDDKSGLRRIAEEDRNWELIQFSKLGTTMIYKLWRNQIEDENWELL